MILVSIVTGVGVGVGVGVGLVFLVPDFVSSTLFCACTLENPPISDKQNTIAPAIQILLITETVRWTQLSRQNFDYF
jgi:hypothetical protein